MAKPTLSEISKLFKTDDKPTDFHYYGTVVSADTDNRTYEVSINRDKNITVEAARLVGAHVGDTVMVTVMANGYATVTGRVGGDTDATDAQRAADSAASVADSARTTATNALNSATQASGIAAEAKTKAENAIGLAEEAEAEAGRARDAADESERQADLSRQAAQASAQQAESSRQAADLSAQNALGSKISADAAQEAAEAAQDAAEDAQSASESARDRAISAEGYAQQANTHATQAETYAGQALSSAETANTAANSAITQLGVVQDVVGVLDWVSTHATYKTSRDTSVVAGKMYFTKSGNTYTLVVNPTGNPSTQGYYEIDSIDEAVTNYVASHLALTNDGLWVTKDNNGYKILVSNTGVKIYDPQGILVSTFGESISFSSTRPQKIGNNNQYIEYYNDNGTYKVRIVADNITLGGSNVATTLSNLAAADTAQTNALNAYKTSNDAAVAANATGLANYIASNNSVIERLERQIDGAIDTWYYSGVPTLNNDPAKNWPANTYESHERDLYFDTSTGHTYRFARTGNTEPYTYEWIEIQDADALRALQAAAAAQDTADNKRRVFTVSSNDHPVPPYDVGDLWVQGQNGDILRCVQTRLDPQVWASTDWQPASKYTDDSAVTALAGNVYTKSEVYTKQNIDTKIGEINTTITSKETTIKQYADTKASAAQTAAEATAAVDATNKANAAKQAAIDDAASKYYTKTQTYTKSEIEQKAGEISLSVAQEEVSKVEVGGRNLVPNSKYVAPDSNTGYVWGRNKQYATVIPGETYTLSLYYNGERMTTVDHGYAYAYAIKSDGTKISGDYMGAPAARSTRVIEQDVVQLEVYAGGLRNYVAGDVYCVKLEKGNKATDWTPAPEDTDADIAALDTRVSSAESTLSVLPGQISSKVSKTDYNGNEIKSLINQSADSVKIAANQVNVEGATLFTSGRLSQTSLDAAYSVKIGGRNLVWDTEWKNISMRWTNWGAPTTREIVTLDGKRWLHLVTTAKSYQGYSQNWTKRENPTSEIQAGDTIVFSYTAYAETAGQVCTVGCHWNDSSGSIVNQNWFASSLTTTPKRYTSQPFTVPANAVKFNVMIGQGVAQVQNLYITEVKIEKGNRATDWTPAPDDYVANTAALSRTQRIYYRSDSSTLPNPPTENNKGKWFEPTQSDTGYNTWSRDIVPLIGGFHYLFMCDQTQTAAQYVAGNECTNSSVMRDDSTSVIDGGSITTGRINANYIDASTLQIGYGQVDGLGEFMSLMTFKDGVLRIAKPGSRFAVELSDDGLFFKQNDTAVSYINMNRLYIPYAVVLDQMMIGKEENNSLWAWTSEEDGSLTLKWIGGNN